MIPLTLKLAGIMSYKHPKEKPLVLDFKTLGEQGLFGVFGPTGSGKSTLLDAITLALFGETERLSGVAVPGGYLPAMLNRQVPEAFVELEFQVGEKRYEVHRAWRRINKRAGDEIEFKDKEVWLKVDGKSVKEADKSSGLNSHIQEILGGLTRQQFSTAFIVPQGKFAQLLHMKPVDRAKLLFNLFHLEGYDLTPQIKAYKDDIRQQIDFTKGQLERYVGVSEELAQNINLEFIAHEKYISDVKKAHEETSIEKKKWEDRLLVHNQLKDVQNNYTAWQAKSPAMEEMRHVLKLADEAEILMGDWRAHTACGQELKARQEQFAKSETEYQASYVLKAQAAKNLANAQAEADEKMPSLELLLSKLMEGETAWKAFQEAEYNHKNANENYIRLKKDFDKIKQRVEGFEVQERATKEQIKEAEITLNTLQSQQAHWQAMLPIKMKYDNWKLAQVEHEKAKNDLSRASDKNKIANEELAQLRANAQADDEQSHAVAISAIENAVSNKEDTATHLRNRSGLSQYVSLLKDGEPCPLCGAGHHPHPIMEGGLAEELSAVETELRQLKNSLQHHRQIAMLWPVRQRGCQQSHEDAERAGKQFAFRSDACKALLEEWQPHSPAELEKADNEYKTATEKVKNATTGHLKLKDSIDSIEKQIEKLRPQLEKAIAEIAVAENVNTTTVKRMQETKQAWDALQLSTSKPLAKQISDCHHELETVENLILNAKQAEASSITQEAVSLEKLKNDKVNLARQQETMQALNAGFQKLLANSVFKDLEGWEEYLKQKPSDLDATRRSFEDWNTEGVRLKSNLDKLNAQVAEAPHRPEAHAVVEQKFQQLEIELAGAQQKMGILSERKSMLEAAWANKKRLEETYGRMAKHADLLADLDTLLKGKKLEQYVLNIRMNAICMAASERLERLSNNRYVLESDVYQGDKYDFRIRDRLNENGLRPVQNLSGGETFLVSLCLAIALSDAIRRGKAGFIFLDEGFGNLDTETLDKVLDTLEELSNCEARVIGLISHVRELQERIGGAYPYLQVRPPSPAGQGSHVEMIAV